MQVGFRSLLTVALAIGAVSCMVDDHGLGSSGGGKLGSDASAGNQGMAGSGAPSPGAAGSMTMSGAAGDAMPMAGATGSAAGASPVGAAGAGAAGTGASSGAAGAPVGNAGTNGGAGVAGTAGASGAAGTAAPAGQAGIAGTAGVTGAAGGAGAGSGAGAGGAAGGAGGAGGKGGSGAAGSPAAGATGTPGEFGCSDGTREGYVDRVKYPRIAACEGAWDEPGLASLDARTPQCNRRAGNDGDRADGNGCSMTDICASGWAVCDTAHAVSTAAPSGCADAIAPYGDSPVFFVTRQRGTGLVCDPNNQVGTNNLYGCGNIGTVADKSCAPFSRMLRDSDCQMNWPWVCAEGPIGTSQNEYSVVTKAGPSKGGVLCCKN